MNVDTDGDGYWDPLDANPLDPDIPVARVTLTPTLPLSPTAMPSRATTPTQVPQQTPTSSPTLAAAVAPTATAVRAPRATPTVRPVPAPAAPAPAAPAPAAPAPARPPTGSTLSDQGLGAQESDGIVYFIFQSPARIERYDMTAEKWLDGIPMSDTPTAFAVDTDGIYVGFGRSTSRFDLDGTNERHLANSNTDATSLFTANEFLYVFYQNSLMSIDKTSGETIDTSDTFYRMQGISVAPTIGKAFGRTTGVSPSDIIQINLNRDGTLSGGTDSPYHGGYPNASKTFVFPGGARVADDSGTVYNTNDLSYNNSLAGRVDDIAFYGDLPIVLREGALISYSNAFVETGNYTPDEPPNRIFVMNDSVFSFRPAEDGIEVAKIPIGLLEPAEPGEPVNPSGLAYAPDSALMGQGDIVYLLSRDNLSIFGWSVPERKYLETIALIEAPIFMAYSVETNRIYLAYPSGKITQVDLDTSAKEKPFANSPQTPRGLATAGEHVFVYDPTGAWGSHFTYSPDGALVSQVEWNHYSKEYVWNAANQKMYFFRDGMSPNDLLWEDIDASGTIGVKKDSPYHSSDGIRHPIRVAPDGSVVLLGSGRIYDAISLEQLDTLSNDINDAVWRNGALFTLRALDEGTQLQKWTEGYAAGSTKQLEGVPIRLHATDEGLLVITQLDDGPSFSIWDLELNGVYQLE